MDAGAAVNPVEEVVDEPPAALDDEEWGPMSLTQEERELAEDIKTVVELDSEIRPLSDYLCAQFAIFALTQNDPPTLPEIIDQVKAFNEAKVEHMILDSYQDGLLYVEHFLRDLVPGYTLSAMYGEPNAVVVDIGNFDMRLLDDDNRVREWIAGLFYMNHAATKSFQTTRDGLNLFVECEGFKPPTNMYRINPLLKWGEFGATYPLRFASFRHFHTNLVVNLIVSASKTVLPSFLHEHFEVGCQMNSRLDEIFLVPDLETANDRILASVQKALQERYEHEKSSH